MEQHANQNRPPAASEERVASLPRVKIQIAQLHKDHLDCAICQDDFSENQDVIKLTPCNHFDFVLNQSRQI